MTQETLKTRIERLLAEQKKKAEQIDCTIQALENMLSATEDVPDEVLAALESRRVDESPVNIASQEKMPNCELGDTNRKTNFDKISGLLRKKENSPHTITAISAATGIPKPSVAAVVYRTHKKEFRNFGIKGYNRLRAWCLVSMPAGERAVTSISEQVLHKRHKLLKNKGGHDQKEEPEDSP